MKDETADQILLSVIFDEERNGHLFHMKSGAQSRRAADRPLHSSSVHFMGSSTFVNTLITQTVAAAAFRQRFSRVVRRGR